MNIDEKIKAAIVYKDDLQQQIRSIEGQSALLQQRHQTLVLAFTRADGALSALQEYAKEDFQDDVRSALAEPVKEEKSAQL